jgi:hypothetical protein
MDALGIELEERRAKQCFVWRAAGHWWVRMKGLGTGINGDTWSMLLAGELVGYCGDTPYLTYAAVG